MDCNSKFEGLGACIALGGACKLSGMETNIPREQHTHTHKSTRGGRAGE